jgi:hypothetical protein
VIYDETASSVILFGKVVGENFRAQIVISLINTALTIIGLFCLKIGFKTLLAVIVFSCGLIPVLGVFISSIPIMLIAVNDGGGTFHKLYMSVGLIAFIHIVEAYVLNPRIVSSVHRLNPVITLMILYIAHSLMGIWGMFLGLPISVYIYRQLILPRTNGVDEKGSSSLELENRAGGKEKIPEAYFGDDSNGFEVPYYDGEEEPPSSLGMERSEEEREAPRDALPDAFPGDSPGDAPDDSPGDSPEDSPKS